MKPLAATSFSGGVNEKLAAVDVHKATGEIFSGVETAQFPTFSLGNSGGLLSGLVSSGATSLLSGGFTGVPAVPSMVGGFTGLGGLAASPSSILSSVSGFSSQAASALQSASGPLQSALTQARGVVSQVTTTIGGVTSTIKNIKEGGVSAIFDTLSAVVDPSVAMGLKDISSAVTLGSNLVKQAATGGIGGVFSALANTPAFAGNPLQEIAKSAIPVITMAGNIKALGEVAKQQGPAILSAALAPTLGMDVLANYKAVKSEAQEIKATLKGEWSEMKGVVTSLQSDFMTAKKNLQNDVNQAKTMLSSKNLKTASKDAVSALKQEVSTSTQLANVALSKKSPVELASMLLNPPSVIPEGFILPTLMPAPSLNLPILKNIGIA